MQKQSQKNRDEAPDELGKQQRALETRRQLICSARKVFARDGFAQARLEEIAADAGKTRGAFYAHFRDKEDLFFAMFEEDTRRDKERLVAKLSKATTQDERVEMLARHMLEVLEDKRRVLLNLEFKAYAIRHPEHERRLDALVSMVSTLCAELGVDRVVPELREDNLKIKRLHAAEFGALMDGLAINRLFNPSGLDKERTLRILRAGVRSILVHAAEDLAKRRKSPRAAC